MSAMPTLAFDECILMDEFEFIAKYLAPLAGPGGLGLKDDAAVLKPSHGKDLIITKDTMVEGTHFPHGHYGAKTSGKLLRANLSDLAAKGAIPVGYMLSIVWPHGVDESVFKDFSDGLAAIQKKYDFKLLGGDTTSSRGAMVVTATLLGEVPENKMVRRNGANIGDDVWVTGTIGDAYLGLQKVLGRPIDPKPKGTGMKHFENAYFRPEPRISFGDHLRDYASACADISDGLIADAGHVAKASNIKFKLNLEAIPLSRPAAEWAMGDLSRIKTLVTSGDDYELVFTAPSTNESFLTEASAGLQLTKIGTVVEGSGVEVVGSDNTLIEFDQAGHKHF